MRNDIAVAIASIHAFLDGKLEPNRANLEDVLDSLRSVDASLRSDAMRASASGAGVEATLGRVVEAAPVPIVLAESATIVLANVLLEQLLGYGRNELIGKPVETIVPPRFRDADPGLRTYLSGPSSLTAGPDRDLFALHRDGSEIPVEVACNPIETHNGPAVMAAIVDLTERKRSEALRLNSAWMVERNRQLSDLNRGLESTSRFKSAFVATMSHELRTPLSAIIGMSELMTRSAVDDTQLEHLETINESAQALLGIINSILDLSKIEAGKIDLRSASLDLRSIVESAAEILAQRAREKGLALHTYVDPRIVSVRGDGDRLRQIFVNLIGNAVKFTERGYIVVRAFPLDVSARHATVRFEVRDTGIGIAPQDRSRLFEPFVQADSSMSRSFEGSGLGLTISKSLVELMNGQIGIEGSPGAGSLFWFTAQFELATPAPQAVGPLENVIAVLLSEDDILAQIVESYAQSWGMKSLRCRTWTEMSALTGSCPGVGPIALVDLDARAAAEALRALQSGRYDAGRTVAIGSGRLTKPIRQSHLFDAIMRAVDPSAPFTHTQPKPADLDQDLSSSGPILIAEDNARLRKLLKLQFDDIGVPCRFVGDGVEALDALDREHFAMVFMDCHMPNMNGLETTHRIRDRERSAGGHIPIVAMTANAFAEDRDLCISAGMDDYLAKPASIADLRSIVARWSMPGGLHGTP
jgi:two-component system sensor histidine kinase/response regulator